MMFVAFVNVPFLNHSIHQQLPFFRGLQLVFSIATGKFSVDTTVSRPSWSMKKIQPVVTPVPSNNFCRTFFKRGEISVPSFNSSAISFSTRKLESLFNSLLCTKTPPKTLLTSIIQNYMTRIYSIFDVNRLQL